MKGIGIKGIGLERRVVMGYDNPYYRNILNLSPIAYWPLWESSGAVATDVSGNLRYGVYGTAGAAPTKGQPGIGDGQHCPSFDGGDIVDIYSAGFIAAFSGSSGSIALWAKMDAVGTWTDAANHYFIHLYVDGNNSINIRKSSTNNTIQWLYQAGGISKTRNKASLSTLSWMNLVLTWDHDTDKVQAYYNGVAEGVVLTGLGDWGAGALSINQTVIGAFDRVGSLGHKGWLAHVAIWNRPLIPTEVASIAYAPFLI